VSATEAAEAVQVAQDQPLVGTLEMAIVESLEDSLNPFAAVVNSSSLVPSSTARTCSRVRIWVSFKLKTIRRMINHSRAPAAHRQAPDLPQVHLRLDSARC
jgi:hypothetical protein